MRLDLSPLRRRTGQLAFLFGTVSGSCVPAFAADDVIEPKVQDRSVSVTAQTGGEISLGIVPLGSLVDIDVTFTGDKDWRPAQADVSCDCTVIRTYPEEIRAGTEHVLSLQFPATNLGDYRAEAWIADDAGNRFSVVVTAEVVEGEPWRGFFFESWQPLLRPRRISPENEAGMEARAAVELARAGAPVLDLRPADERKWGGTIPGALPVPLWQARVELQRLSNSALPVLMILPWATDSQTLARHRLNLPERAHIVRDGVRGWRTAGGPWAPSGDAPGWMLPVTALWRELRQARGPYRVAILPQPPDDPDELLLARLVFDEVVLASDPQASSRTPRPNEHRYALGGATYPDSIPVAGDWEDFWDLAVREREAVIATLATPPEAAAQGTSAQSVSYGDALPRQECGSCNK